MWVSKAKYDKLVKESDELERQVAWVIDMYGDVVEDASDEGIDSHSFHSCRMIHPAMKSLLLSGFNRLCKSIGREEQFKISSKYTR